MSSMDQAMQTFGQMICLPMTLFSEAVSRTMRDFQPAGFLPAVCAPCEAKTAACAPIQPEVCTSDWSCAPRPTGWGSCGTCGRAAGECCCNRGSDRVKLIEFSLVTVRRNAKCGVLWSGQRLVSDCTTPDEFQNQIVVEYVQSHCDRPVDGKNLRVYTRVLDSWCKSDFDWEEEQIDALQEIRDAILVKKQAA